jgi:hypothetical protein
VPINTTNAVCGEEYDLFAWASNGVGQSRDFVVASGTTILSICDRQVPVQSKYHAHCKATHLPMPG